MPDGARWKSCWFCLASWTKSLQETSRKLARLYQTASEFYFVYKKRQNLVLSGSIWPASFKFPANFWSRKPDRTSNFFIWLRLAWFCLAVWAWCSQSIKRYNSLRGRTSLKSLFNYKVANYRSSLDYIKLPKRYSQSSQINALCPMLLSHSTSLH